jgi:hypothetical protein
VLPASDEHTLHESKELGVRLPLPLPLPLPLLTTPEAEAEAEAEAEVGCELVTTTSRLAAPCPAPCRDPCSDPGGVESSEETDVTLGASCGGRSDLGSLPTYESI